MERLEVDGSRRAFLVKMAYTAPLIVTMSVLPSIASAGSLAIAIDGIGVDGEGEQKTQKHHRNNHNKWSPW
jgi:hypothetical protein